MESCGLEDVFGRDRQITVMDQYTNICSGINPLATSFELVHYFEVASPKIIAVDASLLQNVLEALWQLKFAPKVMVIEDSPSAEWHDQLVVSEDTILQSPKTMAESSLIHCIVSSRL